MCIYIWMVGIQLFTENSIPLTTNYMYLSIDTDMDTDIRFQIQNQIPTSLQNPAAFNT